MFGPAAITHEFSKKLLKWKADVGEESTKCATFKIQAVEAANLRVFVGMVKRDAELKTFHSMLKYNNFLLLKYLWKCYCFYGGSPTGIKTVDIQDSMGQAMSTA